MASMISFDLGEDPLPDFMDCEVGDSCEDFPEKEWLWRELKSSSKSGGGGGGGHRGRNRFPKHNAPSALCEPVDEDVTLDLMVESDGFVTVNMCVGGAKSWALSCWELEGLMRMGESRQERVRQKRDNMWRKLHLDSTSSAEIAAKVYCEANSPNVQGSFNNSGEMSDHHQDSNHILDSARDAKSKDDFENTIKHSKSPPEATSATPETAFPLDHQCAEKLRTQTKLGIKVFEWARSRLRNKQATRLPTRLSWRKIRDSMLCCILGTHI